MIYCEDCHAIFLDNTIELHVKKHHSGPYPVHHDNMPDWIQDNITDDTEEIHLLIRDRAEDRAMETIEEKGQTPR